MSSIFGILCWPIAPSYESQIGGDTGGCRTSANEYRCTHHVTWSPNKLWRSTSPHLTYAFSSLFLSHYHLLVDLFVATLLSLVNCFPFKFYFFIFFSPLSLVFHILFLLFLHSSIVNSFPSFGNPVFLVLLFSSSPPTSVDNFSPAMGARNQVGIGLSYRPASLCSLAT